MFDIGGVLLTFDPGNYLEKYVAEPELRKEIAKKVFRSELWLDLDRGLIERQEVINRLSKQYPQWSEIIEQAVSGWEEMLDPIPGTVEILKNVKARDFQIFVLSNFPRRAYENARDKFPFLRLFAGGIISSRVGVIKPDKRIYEILLARYGLNPEETLFIDDSRPNVEGARRLGIAGIVFEEPSQLGSELEGYGVSH